MAIPDLQMNPQMEHIHGEIRDNFRALANGFQKLDKIEDSTGRSKQLEDLTGKMRECKRLIKEFDREIEVEESKSSPEVSKKLKEEKQLMIKAMNSYVALIKIYQSTVGNKRVELFIMETGNSEPMADDNAHVASEMVNQELNLAGNKTMDETDLAIERTKKLVHQTVEVGTQTAAKLEGQTDQMVLIVNEPDTIQASVKKASQLVKETGHPVSTHNLQNNSPSSSSSITPTSNYSPPSQQFLPFGNCHQPPQFSQPQQLTQQQDLFQQMQQLQFPQQMQPPPSQQMQPPLPEPSRQRKGKKPVSTKKTPWTPDDEKRLAECWVHVSEEKKVGNSQTPDSFWYRVKDEYNAGTSVQRTKDQLSSKWRDLNLCVTKFNGIYTKLTNARANGDSDLNVMERALETYLGDGGHAFKHLHVWNVLKDKPKWLKPNPVVIGRRNKKRPRDEEEDSPINLDDHELFCEDAIPHPPIKPRKSKSQRSSSMGVHISEGSSHGNVVFADRNIKKVREIYQTKNSLMKSKLEYIQEKLHLKQLKFLSLRTDGMIEQDRELVEKHKAVIRKKLNL